MRDYEINEAIKNLLLEKEKYRKLYEEALDVCKFVHAKLYSIGAPLNDNVLKFNSKQLQYLMQIGENVKYIVH